MSESELNVTVKVDAEDFRAAIEQAKAKVVPEPKVAHWKRATKWLLWQLAIVALIVLSSLYGTPGAKRVVVFVVWVSVIWSWVGAIVLAAGALAAPEKFDPKSRKLVMRRPVPRAASVVLDISVVLFMVYVGWTFTPIAWLSTQLVESIVYGLIPYALSKEPNHHQ